MSHSSETKDRIRKRGRLIRGTGHSSYYTAKKNKRVITFTRLNLTRASSHIISLERVDWIDYFRKKILHTANKDRNHHSKARTAEKMVNKITKKFFEKAVEDMIENGAKIHFPKLDTGYIGIIELKPDNPAYEYDIAAGGRCYRFGVMLSKRFPFYLGKLNSRNNKRLREKIKQGKSY